MREILFRGKITQDKWVYGFYENVKLEEATIHYVNGKIVSSKTVGQYTGLTDKNGKKIFEGDIVRVKGKETEENWKDYDEFGKVVFENGAFLIKVANIFNGKKYFSEVHSRYMTTADWVEREVVGNVFENKELLGENK